jgi:hypothetical protein
MEGTTVNFSSDGGATCLAEQAANPGKTPPATDLQPSILQKRIKFQWFEASFHCMERSKGWFKPVNSKHDEKEAHDFWIPRRVSSTRVRASGRAEPATHQQRSTSARGNRSSEINYRSPA